MIGRKRRERNDRGEAALARLQATLDQAQRAQHMRDVTVPVASPTGEPCAFCGTPSSPKTRWRANEHGGWSCGGWACHAAGSTLPLARARIVRFLVYGDHDHDDRALVDVADPRALDPPFRFAFELDPPYAGPPWGWITSSMLDAWRAQLDDARLRRTQPDAWATKQRERERRRREDARIARLARQEAERMLAQGGPS